MFMSLTNYVVVTRNQHILHIDLMISVLTSTVMVQSTSRFAFAKQIDSAFEYRDDQLVHVIHVAISTRTSSWQIEMIRF